MHKLHSLFIVSFITALIPLESSANECLVSKPNIPAPPGSIPVNKPFRWIGNQSLAAVIPIDGKWLGMGAERNYANKFWWWADGFSAHGGATPELVISAKNLLDGTPLPQDIQVGSAFGDDWNALLVGMRFPSAGCWEITGSYQGNEIKMVVQVGD